MWVGWCECRWCVRVWMGDVKDEGYKINTITIYNV